MKIEAIYTVTKIYDVHPANYPTGLTPEEIVKFDQEAIMQDPEGFFSDIDTEKLDLEIIEE